MAKCDLEEKETTIARYSEKFTIKQCIATTVVDTYCEFLCEELEAVRYRRQMKQFRRVFF